MSSTPIPVDMGRSLKNIVQSPQKNENCTPPATPQTGETIAPVDSPLNSSEMVSASTETFTPQQVASTNCCSPPRLDRPVKRPRQIPVSHLQQQSVMHREMSVSGVTEECFPQSLSAKRRGWYTPRTYKKVPWHLKGVIDEAVNTVYCLKIWHVETRIDLKKKKKLTDKYKEGVQMLVVTLKEKFNFDVSARPPKWITIQNRVVKAMKEHQVKSNKEGKVTGDGARKQIGQIKAYLTMCDARFTCLQVMARITKSKISNQKMP